MLKTDSKRVFDLINVNKNGVSLNGGGAEKEDIFFFGFLCFSSHTKVIFGRHAT